MAALSAVPKKPTLSEYLAMLSGPKVDVYVGEARKHYNLPKNLLCYYSQYFNRCFNGSFKEAMEQKLELLEDTVEDFEILLEFMLHHSSSTLLAGLSKKKTGITSSCMSFISYADQYAMGSMFCDVFYETLEKQLRAYASRDISEGRITPAHVELIFRITQAGSPMRTLFVRDVLSANGLQRDYDEFAHIEEAIPDFTLEMLRETRRSLTNAKVGDGLKFLDPLYRDFD